jgi:dolichol kinase
LIVGIGVNELIRSIRVGALVGSGVGEGVGALVGSRSGWKGWRLGRQRRWCLGWFRGLVDWLATSVGRGVGALVGRGVGGLCWRLGWQRMLVPWLVP